MWPKIFKTMLRYSLFSLSIRNWVKMLQLTSSIQQRKEDILNGSDILQKDTRLARVELLNKRDECSDYIMSLYMCCVGVNCGMALFRILFGCHRMVCRVTLSSKVKVVHWYAPYTHTHTHTHTHTRAISVATL